MDSTPPREDPQDVLESEVVPQSSVQDLRGSGLKHALKGYTIGFKGPAGPSDLVRTQAATLGCRLDRVYIMPDGGWVYIMPGGYNASLQLSNAPEAGSQEVRVSVQTLLGGLVQSLWFRAEP